MYTYIVRRHRTALVVRKTITWSLLNALCDRLLEKPDVYQDETALFLWDNFDTLNFQYQPSTGIGGLIEKN